MAQIPLPICIEMLLVWNAVRTMATRSSQRSLKLYKQEPKVENNGFSSGPCIATDAATLCYAVHDLQPQQNEREQWKETPEWLLQMYITLPYFPCRRNQYNEPQKSSFRTNSSCRVSSKSTPRAVIARNPRLQQLCRSDADRNRHHSHLRAVTIYFKTLMTRCTITSFNNVHSPTIVALSSCMVEPGGGIRLSAQCRPGKVHIIYMSALVELKLQWRLGFTSMF